jgi:hypothetical protein
MIPRGNGSETRGRPSRPAKAALLTLALTAVAALGLLTSACGGSGDGVAQGDTTETTSTTGSNTQGDSNKSNPAAYSACMRENGVPTFPDPDPNGGISIQGEPGSGLDPSSPQFKAAERVCQRLLPSIRPDPQKQVEDLEQALKYSACMRKNGLPTFPDPKRSNDGGMAIVGRDFDPSSPRFKAAEKACKELLPGTGGDRVRVEPNQTP